jgi:hypothetical protein
LTKNEFFSYKEEMRAIFYIDNFTSYGITIIVSSDIGKRRFVVPSNDSHVVRVMGRSTLYCPKQEMEYNVSVEILPSSLIRRKKISIRDPLDSFGNLSLSD